MIIITHVVGGIFAAQPHELFKENREAILSGKGCHFGEYYFGVGVGVPRTKYSASENFAAQKAVLNAKDNLICSYLIEGVSWPKELDKKTVSKLSTVYSGLITVTAKVEKVEVLETVKTNSLYKAVVAVRNDALKNIPRATLEGVKKKLLEPCWLRKNFTKNPQALYEFYLTQKKLNQELDGTDFNNWDERQLDLFCGIKSELRKRDDSAEHTNVLPREEEQEGLKSKVIININETIEF